MGDVEKATIEFVADQFVREEVAAEAIDATAEVVWSRGVDARRASFDNVWRYRDVRVFTAADGARYVRVEDVLRSQVQEARREAVVTAPFVRECSPVEKRGRDRRFDWFAAAMLVSAILFFVATIVATWVA